MGRRDALRPVLPDEKPDRLYRYFFTFCQTSV